MHMRAWVGRIAYLNQVFWLMRLHTASAMITGCQSPAAAPCGMGSTATKRGRACRLLLRKEGQGCVRNREVKAWYQVVSP